MPFFLENPTLALNILIFCFNIIFMGILSHVFQLWEKGGWVNDLFDGWGWVARDEIG